MPLGCSPFGSPFPVFDSTFPPTKLKSKAAFSCPSTQVPSRIKSSATLSSSTTPSSSRSPSPTGCEPKRPSMQKDLEAVVGSLQSSYGLAGLLPTPTPSRPATPTTAVRIKTKVPQHSVHRVPPPPKDFEAAFASLQSSYGLSGPGPVMPRPRPSS